MDNTSSSLENIGSIVNKIVVTFTLLAACLKLTGMVQWSWWTVFSLFILDLTLVVILFVVAIIFVLATKKR